MNSGYINCDCGMDVSFSEDEGRVDCQCGRKYVVTITELTSPTQGIHQIEQTSPSDTISQ